MTLWFKANGTLDRVFLTPESKLRIPRHEQLFACAAANLKSVYGEPSITSAASMAHAMQELQFRKGDIQILITYMPFIGSLHIIYMEPSEKGL